MSYLRYLCLFSYSGVQHILCCVFRRLVYTTLVIGNDCIDSCKSNYHTIKLTVTI
jgi:hypothetical protein